MTPEQIENAIARIAWGKRYIAVKNGAGDEVILIVKPLSMRDRVWLSFVYDRSINMAIKNGLMTEQQILKDAGEKGIWTKEHDEKIKTLENELAKLSEEKELEITKREASKIQRLKESISLMISEMNTKKQSIISMSAERYAEEQKIRAYAYVVTMREEDSKYWNSWEEFLREKDHKLVSNILMEILNSAGRIESKIIRQVAKSPAWRHKWAASKALSLFPVNIIDMTDEQALLIYWSQIYDSVYEAYERPPQDVIDDDEKLDAWLESQSKKVDSEAKNRFKNNSKNLKRRTSSAERHGEVFYLTNPNLAPVADPNLVIDTSVPSTSEVQDLNSDLNKKFLSFQERKIKQAGGYIQEEDLRSDSDSRRVIGSQDAITHRGKNRDGMTTRHVDKLLPGGTISGRREG